MQCRWLDDSLRMRTHPNIPNVGMPDAKTMGIIKTQVDKMVAKKVASMIQFRITRSDGLVNTQKTYLYRDFNTITEADAWCTRNDFAPSETSYRATHIKVGDRFVSVMMLTEEYRKKIA